MFHAIFRAILTTPNPQLERRGLLEWTQKKGLIEIDKVKFHLFYIEGHATPRVLR